MHEIFTLIIFKIYGNEQYPAQFIEKGQSCSQRVYENENRAQEKVEEK